jgi:hypothetical protein
VEEAGGALIVEFESALGHSGGDGVESLMRRFLLLLLFSEGHCVVDLRW